MTGSIERRKNIAKSITELSRLSGYRDGFMAAVKLAIETRKITFEDAEELLHGLDDNSRALDIVRKRTGLKAA